MIPLALGALTGLAVIAVLYEPDEGSWAFLIVMAVISIGWLIWRVAKKRRPNR